jgi:hypothetical protein
MGDAAMSDIRQADLSHLRVQDMTPEQKAEMKRRFEEFATVYLPGKQKAEPEQPRRAAVKWVPGMKR